MLRSAQVFRIAEVSGEGASLARHFARLERFSIALRWAIMPKRMIHE
jgi:hypothetical protein